MTKLRVITGSTTGVEFELIGERIRAGRDLDNDIRFDESNVSRHHAEFLHSGTTYLLRDLRSSNGTFVNDLLIADHVVLHNGDKIRFANIEMRFETSAATNSSPTIGLKTPVFRPVNPVSSATTPIPSPGARIQSRNP